MACTIARNRVWFPIKVLCRTFTDTSSKRPSDSDTTPLATNLLTRWNIGGPRADQVLASHEYWNSFYKNQENLPCKGDFDWYIKFSHVQPIIEHYTHKIPPAGILLHLGCGTSDFSEIMSERHPLLRVVHGDFSAEALRIMSRKHPALTWVRMDARALPLASNAIDCVIEKGTMDALLRSGNESWFEMCCEVLRVLRPGGCFLQITDEVPELRLPLLEHLQPGWSISFKAIGDPADADGCFLYRCTKS